eukprot:1977386-Rhodomonas_salina.1
MIASLESSPTVAVLRTALAPYPKVTSTSFGLDVPFRSSPSASARLELRKILMWESRNSSHNSNHSHALWLATTALHR